VGVDCVGLLACAAREAGLRLEDVPANYGRIPDGSLEQYLERYCDRILSMQLELGAVLAFRVYSVRPRHLALLTGLDPLTMIHAYQGADLVAEHEITEWWRSRLHSVWRLRA
jgi:cell wall-associated NlpC family hydrolase